LFVLCLGFVGRARTARRNRKGLRPSAGCEARKLPLQPVHFCQIAACIVISTSLATCEPEAAAGVGVASPAPAQVDHGGEVLTLL
jgi:hypothetical protein